MTRPLAALARLVAAVRAPRRVALWPLALLATACTLTRGLPAVEDGPAPYALVLGTAQDGGLPQLGCERDCCRRAWRSPGLRRLVSSLLIVDPRSGGRWLIDATPDLVEQVERAREHGRPLGTGHRPPLFAGVFLTHLHMGHYAGLLHLGKEAYASQTIPLHASERACAFLRAEAPWSALVEDGHLKLHPIADGETIHLAPGLSITPLAVPHRDEFSDTFAFRIEGPGRSLLYLPDIDKWEHWNRAIETELARVDVALLDGTFFDTTEVPGRDHTEILHPLIARSLRRFAALPFRERSKVRFTHLNHSNPAADRRSAERARIERAGMAVVGEGERIELGERGGGEFEWE